MEPAKAQPGSPRSLDDLGEEELAELLKVIEVNRRKMEAYCRKLDEQMRPKWEDPRWWLPFRSAA